jgi:hypothetical protein
MTVAVAVDGRSAVGGLGVEGGGLDTSCAHVHWAAKMHEAAINADTLTLILTPNLPLLPCLETVCAVEGYTVLIVITQEYVRIFARALIAET